MKKSTVKKALIVFLLLIEVNTVFLMYKSLENKPKKLDEVKLKNTIENNNDFAIMIENNEGQFVEDDTLNAFPTTGYIFNHVKSGCIDNKGVMINGALDYQNGQVVINTDQTLYCYVYFSISNPTVSYWSSTTSESTLISADSNSANKVADFTDLDNSYFIKETLTPTVAESDLYELVQIENGETVYYGRYTSEIFSQNECNWYAQDYNENSPGWTCVKIASEGSTYPVIQNEACVNISGSAVCMKPSEWSAQNLSNTKTAFETAGYICKYYDSNDAETNDLSLANYLYCSSLDPDYIVTNEIAEEDAEKLKCYIDSNYNVSCGTVADNLCRIQGYGRRASCA